VLLPEEGRAFLEAAREDRLEALYVVAVAVGLRRGELLELDGEPKLRVGHQFQRMRDGLGRRFVAPKGGKGRKIRLPARTAEALKAPQVPQAEIRLKAGSLYQDGGSCSPRRSAPYSNPPTWTGAASSRSSRKRDCRHPLPRPTSYLCHCNPLPGCEPEVRPGALGARGHQAHVGHLLALPAEHGRPDRQRHGERPQLSGLQHRCSKSAPAFCRGLLRASRSSCKSGYFERADERTRTAFLLITSVRSTVTRRCRSLQIPPK
jgi:hypothetical protein